MSQMSQSYPNALLKRLPLVIVLAVAVIGGYALKDHLNFAALAAHRETLLAWRDAHYLLTVAGFIAAYAVMVGFGLPGATIATLTGGFLFATFPGVLFNITAATLGAMGIFLVARAGLGAQLAARMDGASGPIKRLKEGIDRSQWEMLFLMRLVPVVPFFVANLLPALVGVPLSRYAISTCLGIIPGAIVYTSVGAGLGEVFAAGEAPDLGIIFEPHVLLPLLGLAGLAALPLVIKALRGQKEV